MTQINSMELEIDALSPLAIKVLKAAVAHANKHRDVMNFEIPIDTFRRMAELPDLPGDKVCALLREAQKAAGIESTFDTESPENEDVFGGSIPIIGEAFVVDAMVKFERYGRSLDERIVSKVLSLKVPIV